MSPVPVAQTNKTKLVVAWAYDMVAAAVFLDVHLAVGALPD